MRIQVINNPLVLICKKIDVIKTCQSNIVELDTTHNDRCLETWKTLGIPSITLHLRDIMSQKMRENSWEVKEIKENRHRLVEIEGRERPEPGAVLLISELWYENVGKYLRCKNPGTQFVVTSGYTGTGCSAINYQHYDGAWPVLSHSKSLIKLIKCLYSIESTLRGHCLPLDSVMSPIGDDKQYFIH